jgi:hypothetical protein
MMLSSENSLKPFTDAADKYNKYSIARGFKMSIAKVGVPPHVQPQPPPVQPHPKQPPEAQQTPAVDGAKKPKAKPITPPVQPQTKKSPEEARETPVQKRAEKLKPDTFDILV